MIRIACLLFPALLAPTFLAGNSFRVATWNVQNYLVSNRFEQGRFLLNYPMPENRKQRIRDIILQQSPDLLLLQELGSKAFLAELQLDLAASGLLYPHYWFSGLEDARSGLAFLSRVPPNEVVFHDIGTRRGLQELRFVAGDLVVRFFHIHLKSRYSDDPDDPDASQARKHEILALTRALDLLMVPFRGSLCFVAGDFNTPFNDPLLAPLRHSWHPVDFVDSMANPSTYFHHSGTEEILDGFWINNHSPIPDPQGFIFPGNSSIPSDHKCVILDLPSPP